ncbi:MAG: hypothetical protein K2M91_15615 [Lachnospiraceae bacterium]|nr:hypothetical protein [Lachnospiraceae bacterium]
MPVVELGAVAGVILSRELTVENIEKAVNIFNACGKKIGSKLSAYLKERKMQKGEEENREISPEVKKEVTDSLKEILKSQSIPVYMDGIAFFFEEPMGQEEKALLEEILTNLDEDSEALIWKDEQKSNYQKVVDDYMQDYYGCSPDKNEEEFWIDDDVLYLNFTNYGYGYDFRVCDDTAIRSLVNALNHLLGEKYITSFTTF